MTPAALLDVDGTLVDTNYQHALAWFRAFRGHGVVLPVWRIHRHIGMGGDQLVPALAGEQVERRCGEQIRAAQSEHYRAMLDEVEPMQGARELIDALRERGCRVVLASSAEREHVEHYLRLLDAPELGEQAVTSADVEHTKPAPDLVAAALERAGGRDAVMVGDSTWDCEAARRAGVPTVALLTGGFSEQELTRAGAVRVYESLVELREQLDGLLEATAVA